MRLSKGFIWFIALFGIAIFGYGYYQTRFSIRLTLEVITSFVWPLAVYFGLGIVLLLWTNNQWRSKAPDKPTWYPIIGVLGLCYLALVLISLSLNWKSLLQRYSGDQADQARMSQLAQAKLDYVLPVEANEDWPQWRGPLRNGKSTETGINTNWRAVPPKIAWRHKIGGGYSSISVIGNRLYTMDRQGDQERVICLSAEDGKELWTHSYQTNFKSIDYNAGPRATPAISGKYLYSVGSTGTFLALELPEDPNGKPRELWHHDLINEFSAELPRWGIACSPLVEGNMVIVQPGGINGSVAAFDRNTGKVIWSALSDQNGYSSPILAELADERQVVAFTGKGVAGLRLKDGHLLWYYDWPEQFQGNIATPISAGNFLFISSGYDNGGCALLEISKKAEGFHADPVYAKRRKLMQNHHSTCILHEGCLYGFDKGVLKCVDLRTATEKWVSRKPEKGCLTYADGHLVILSEKGELSIIKASPDKCTILGTMELFDRAETWAVPVLSRGKLYVRDKEEIVCLDLHQPVKQ